MSGLPSNFDIVGRVSAPRAELRVIRSREAIITGSSELTELPEEELAITDLVSSESLQIGHRRAVTVYQGNEAVVLVQKVRQDSCTVVLVER